jgi:3alpha(or 20beta)-hydroxysteroid dehydrogenase
MGEADARRLAAEGANVVIADLREDLGRTVAAEIGAAARFVRHDVTDEESWRNVIAETTEAFGGLDVLVNNAAIWRMAPLETETLDGFMEMLTVDLVSVFLGIRAAISPMRARGGGSIVNMASTAGSVGVREMVAYGTAKWGVRGLTKCAALELAPDGIRVNSIHPGAIDTPMVTELRLKRGPGNMPTTPLQRVGLPEEIAAAVLFLASDESAYITGVELHVDGGSTAGPNMSRAALDALAAR